MTALEEYCTGPLLEEWGANVRLARGRMPRETLAAECDLTATSIYRIETGKQNPGYVNMARIAHALGTRSAVLFPLPDVVKSG